MSHFNLHTFFQVLFGGRSRRFVVGMAAGALLALCLGVSGVVMAATNGVSRTDDTATTSVADRLVTIYDDGTEKTIVTRADTVAAALKDAGISVAKQDVVTPQTGTKLTDTDTNITIYRARPVVIVDGSRQIRVVTAAQDAAGIAKAAGLTLYTEDKTQLSQVTDILAAGGAGQQLTITRAKVVNLNLYGQNVQIRTQAATVADLLSEKSIKLGPNDGTNVGLATPITNQMNLQIWRNGIQTITANEPVPFATQNISDATLAQGTTQVRTPGVNGEKTVVYQVEMKNGQEVSRTEISEVVTKQPITQVQVVGTKVPGPAYSPNGSHEDWMRAAGISDSDFAYVDYIVSHESGWNPNSVNKSSGACGLPQAYPCSKLGPNWNNPVVALSWMNGYVSRYGGWAGAYQHWIVYHSY